MLALSLFFACALAARPADLVTSIPAIGMSPLPFTMYSGFLHLPHSQKHVHYTFVESMNNPSTDPVLAWFNGGPGCSSLEGFLYENGPMKFDDNFDRHNLTMHLNEEGWNNVANVLYLEAPVGVGFSYSGNTNDYSTNDTQTARDNHQSLQEFFRAFPAFTKNDLFLAGESYAGIYVPTLAALVSADPVLDQRFKGFMVGNALSDHRFDSFGESYLPQVHGHGMIPTDLYENAKYACVTHPNQNRCDQFVSQIEAATQDIDPYDIYSPCWSQRGPSSQVGCVDSRKGFDLLQMTSVRQALHVDQSPLTWDLCSTVLSYRDITDSVVPIYKALIAKRKYRFVVYSGDADTVVSYHGTRKWLDYNFKIVGDNWKQWYYPDPVQGGKQVGGWLTEYDGITFATVRGAGHMVPQTEPKKAFHIVSQFLKNQKI